MMPRDKDTAGGWLVVLILALIAGKVFFSSMGKPEPTYFDMRPSAPLYDGLNRWEAMEMQDQLDRIERRQMMMQFDQMMNQN